LPSGAMYGMLGMCCVVIANREQYVGAQQCMEFVCLQRESHMATNQE